MKYRIMFSRELDWSQSMLYV